MATVRQLAAMLPCAAAACLLCGCGSGGFTILQTSAKSGPPQPTLDELAELRKHLEPVPPRRGPVDVLSQVVRGPTVSDVAADALARIGPEALDPLIRALSDANPQVRAQAATALARMGPEAAPAVPTLVTALKDDNAEVRRAAAKALGQIGPEARAAVPALIEALADPDGRAPPPAANPQPDDVAAKSD